VAYKDKTNATKATVMKFPPIEEGTSIYQWYRDGGTIAGATGSTYIITSQDINTTITFGVTPYSQ